MAESSVRYDHFPRSAAAIGATLICSLLLVTPQPASADPAGPALVSKSPTGAAGNAASRYPSVSADGRYIAFDSLASDLVPEDTNNRFDVFVYDSTNSRIERASFPSAGGQATGDSLLPTISDDGRFVAFASSAPLVPEDTNGRIDIFVRDTRAGTTELISVNDSGIVANANSSKNGHAISADGRFVAFESLASNLGGSGGSWNVYLRDRLSQTTELVSRATDGTQAAPTADGSAEPSVSDDGRYVVFNSAADNLVPQDNNQLNDVFVRDRSNGTTARITSTSSGAAGNSASFVAPSSAISADGSTVVFSSLATDLDPTITDTNGRLDAFVANRASQAIRRLEPPDPNAPTWGYSISPNGTYVGLFTVGPQGERISTRHLGSSRTVAGSSGLPGFRNVTTNDGGAVWATSAPLVTNDSNNDYDVYVSSMADHVSDEATPLVTGTADRPPDSAGWYSAPVTIRWESVDPEPSSGGPTQPNPTVVSVEGVDITVESDPSCDPAGNCGRGSVVLSMDRTGPVINFLGVEEKYLVSDRIEISCLASDSLSGIDQAICPEVNVLAAELGTGSHTITASATDIAGHNALVTATFTVTVDARSIADLVDLYLTDAGPAAAGIGQSLRSKAEAGLWSAFIDEVNAQCCFPANGKRFTAHEAEILTALAYELANF